MSSEPRVYGPWGEKNKDKVIIKVQGVDGLICVMPDGAVLSYFPELCSASVPPSRLDFHSVCLDMACPDLPSPYLSLALASLGGICVSLGRACKVCLRRDTERDHVFQDSWMLKPNRDSSDLE